MNFLANPTHDTGNRKDTQINGTEEVISSRPIHVLK